MQSETWDAELDSTCNQVGRYLCCGSLATWRRARRGMSIHTSTLDLPCVAWRLTQLWLPCHDQRVVCYVADTSCRCETASVMALMCDVASCRTMQICIRTKQFGTHAWLSVARCCSSLPYHLMSTLASFPVGSWTVYTFKYASQLPQRVWWLAMLTCFICVPVPQGLRAVAYVAGSMALHLCGGTASLFQKPTPPRGSCSHLHRCRGHVH